MCGIKTVKEEKNYEREKTVFISIHCGWSEWKEKGKFKMAENDNVQLYSNYQSYNTLSGVKSQCSKDRMVRHSESATKKCHRHCRRTAAASTTTRHKTSLTSNHRDNNSRCDKLRHDKRYCVGDNNLISSPDNAAVHRQLPTRKYFSCYNKTNMFTLALLVLISLFNGSCGFVLDGTQNSYAQFRKWYSGLNGSLELEFKTEQPNGLVLYTDDGGTYDFFELKLVEGSLRLRYNLGGGAQIITVGRDIHDGHWHKVQVSRKLSRDSPKVT